ncbi:DUF3592 domain-containing protein [Halorubellus salinus]|uniref:DUF3592 domain-containing protein n=1 Tax=Halorubellus salinus TaxID=755309 RepID=UPI001D0602BB|nr:DUF3592 domain-containing protein [Halorubellus salinus]
MVGTVAGLSIGVGVVLVAAAASIWNRVLRGEPGDVDATVTDAAVVDAVNPGADRGLSVTYSYRYDDDRYEADAVVHPPSLADGEGTPQVPRAYREGATVRVDVPPGHPSEATLPDPGLRATYRVAVPGIVATGVTAIAVGVWLAL